jgi:hypothetical protein
LNTVRQTAVLLGAALAGLADASPAFAQFGAGTAQAAEPAPLSAHPTASFLSLRQQNDLALGAGDNRFQYRLNVRPVIPLIRNTDGDRTCPTDASSSVRRFRAALASPTRTFPARAQDAAAQGGAGANEAAAPDEAQELGMQLANPVSSLISVPFQNNFQFGQGPKDGFRWQLNIQPVIPFSISRDWNLIDRTILPIVYQDNVFGPSGSQFGLSDTTESLFFSPKRPTKGGLIWGVGPAFLIPTGTDTLLTTGQWSIGPTFVALKQQGPLTMGFLTNQLWSVSGVGNHPYVNQWFFQPFFSHTNKKGMTLTLSSETTANWTNGQWTVPIYFQASQVMMIGKQPVSIQGGIGVFINPPDSAPDWNLRFTFTLLYPRK